MKRHLIISKKIDYSEYLTFSMISNGKDVMHVDMKDILLLGAQSVQPYNKI